MVSDHGLNRRNLLKTTGGLVAGATLAGCAGNGNGNGGNGTGSSQPEYIVRPELGDSDRIITGTLDPGFTAPSVDSIGNVFQMHYDFLVAEEPAPSHEIAPQLASDWEVIDSQTIEFEIRDGVQFHSGNELTSEDVAYSFERAYHLDGPAFATFRGFITPDGLNTPDDETFVLELERPWVHVTGALADFAIVDKELVQEHEEDGDWGSDWMEDNTAGCGPYVMTEWDLSQRVRWERFEDYWGEWPENPIEKVEGLGTEEDSTIIQMWQSGDSHYVGHNLAQESYELLNERDDTTIHEFDTIQHWMMTFNTTQAPYDDVNVRRAISAAVDYESAQDLIIPGSQPGAGPVPRPLEGHNDDIEPAGPSDFDAARDFLDNADYTLDEINEAGGMQFSQYRDTGPVRRVPLLWQENLAQVDIESSIQNVTFGEITDSSASPDDAISGYGANYRGGGGAPVTPDPYLYPTHHSSALGRDFYSLHWWQDDEVDELLEAGRDSESIEASYEPYNEAQEIIHDAQPVMWVSNPRHFATMRSEIEGFSFRASTGQRWYPYDWSWNPDA